MSQNNIQLQQSNQKYHKAIGKITGGVLKHVIDMSLWVLFFSGEMALPQSPHGASYKAARSADRLLEQVNYETIKNALSRARKKGLITASGRQGKRAPLGITKAGLARIRSFVPVYDTRRVWDERMYLITYDVKERNRPQRRILRGYLKKIGAGMLQASVWITPYNPRDILRMVIKKHRMHGSIIISDIGTDGSIGDENVVDLVARVYNLIAISDRYREWLGLYSNKNSVDGLGLLHYMAILQDDPQLPFPLLPSWWMGDRAYKRARHMIKKLSN